MNTIIKVEKNDAGVTLNIRDFGAIGYGKTKDTLAIQQTIDRYWFLGGAEVILPAGNYFTGMFLNSLKRFIILHT